MLQFFKRLIIVLAFLFGLIWIYACSLIGVDEKVKSHFFNQRNSPKLASGAKE
jgi:hypothetical protein